MASLGFVPANILNGQSDLDAQLKNVTADQVPLPIVYGSRPVGGKIFALNFNSSTGAITAGYAISEGEIEGYTSHALDGEAPPAGVVITEYTGASGQGVDPTLAAEITGYIDTLDGIAYVVVYMPKGSFEVWPALESEVKGKLCFNPANSQTEYTENPSLHLADFIASTEYGQGWPVNQASLVAAQAANDAIVGGEVRRKSGLVIDGVRTTESWIETLRAYAAVFIDYRDGEAYLIPDRPAASVMSVGAGDMLKGSFTVEKADSSNVPTVVHVVYTAGSSGNTREWRSEPAGTPAPGMRRSVVKMTGIRRHSQAYREAVERKNKLTLSDLTARFTMFDKGIILRLGDVIEVSHPVGLSAKPMRITEPPELISAGRWRIVATEYDPAVYSDSVVNEPTTPDTSLPANGPPAQVTGVTVGETSYQLKSGEYAARLDVAWTASASPFVTSYSVRVLDGVTVVWESVVSGTTASTSALQELKTYTIEVRALSGLYIGAAGQGNHELIGKFAIPDPPASITAFEVGGQVRLKWEKSTDIDAKRYSLRYSTTVQTWDDGIQIDEIDALAYNTDGIPEGTWRIWVKTIDSVFNESTTAAYVDVVVTRDDDAFAAGNLDPMPAGSALTNLHVTEEVRGSAINQYYSDSGELATAIFGSDMMNTKTLPVLAYQNMPGNAIWKSTVLDLLNDNSASFVASIDYQDLSGTAVTGLRLKLDGAPSWGAYGNLARNETARYAQARVYSSGAMLVRAPSGYLRADIKAKEEVGSVTLNSSGPTTITLSRQYAAVRSVNFAPEGTSAVTWAFDNVQLNVGGFTEFDLYAFNSGGAQVSRTGLWTFKGV